MYDCMLSKRELVEKSDHFTVSVTFGEERREPGSKENVKVLLNRNC